ncbi:hypothetical protein LP083-1_050 [Listeria phage LP-083-1]|uniref:Uncharacterized protein n=1 Tax=Listeria phage LP-083-1 TaxID=1458854 RepID=A0A059T890_9CAUD|nr:hypothetical protein LP083-1_050 [Listeria phage LP-083-1]
MLKKIDFERYNTHFENYKAYRNFIKGHRYDINPKIDTKNQPPHVTPKGVPDGKGR